MRDFAGERPAGFAAARGRPALLDAGGDKSENLGDVAELGLDPCDRPFGEPPASMRNHRLEQPHQGYLQALDRLRKGRGVVHVVLLPHLTNMGKQNTPSPTENLHHVCRRGSWPRGAAFAERRPSKILRYVTFTAERPQDGRFWPKYAAAGNYIDKSRLADDSSQCYTTAWSFSFVESRRISVHSVGVIGSQRPPQQPSRGAPD